MFGLPPWFERHLARHTAAIPKGFLRFYVIMLLSEKPMSGSEIIEEISKRTGGLWKPSPGSIYPLLAWLRDRGLIREIPSEDGGMKRYELTEKGKKMLDQHRRIVMGIRRGHRMPPRHMPPPPPFPKSFVVPFLLSLYSERARDLVELMRELFRVLFEFKLNIEYRYSKDILEEFKGLLRQFIDKIKEINRRLEGESE